MTTLNIIILLVLILAKIFIIVYSLRLIVKEKFISIQFNWLIIACVKYLMVYLMLLLYEPLSNHINILHYEIIIIYLFVISFSYMSLFFSKFYKLFLNAYYKRFFFFFTIISNYIVLIIMCLIIVMIPSYNTNLHEMSFLNIFVQYHPLFNLFIIFPLVNIILFLITLLRNSKILSNSIKILYFSFIFYFVLSFVSFLSGNLIDTYLFIIFLSKLLFTILLIKNIVIDKGRYSVEKPTINKRNIRCL